MSKMDQDSMVVKNVRDGVLEFYDIKGRFFRKLFFIDFSAFSEDLLYFSVLKHTEIDPDANVLESGSAGKHIYLLSDQSEASLL